MKTSEYTIFYADDDIDDQDFFKEVISQNDPPVLFAGRLIV